MAHRPAGGLKSRQVTERNVRVGSGAKSVSRAWTSQIGQSMGNHITERGETMRDVRARGPYNGPGMNPTKYGNEIAATTVCGVGGSRVVHKTGQQRMYGAVNSGSPTPKRRSFD